MYNNQHLKLKIQSYSGFSTFSRHTRIHEFMKWIEKDRKSLIEGYAMFDHI